MILEGAGKAAVGTEVLILDRLDPNACSTCSTTGCRRCAPSSARQAIHALDASRRPQFGTNQILVIADGFANRQALNDFCTANGITRCEPVVIQG